MDKGKRNDYVVELLKNFRSYAYAVNFDIERHEPPDYTSGSLNIGLNRRMPTHPSKLDGWDRDRYKSIVAMILGAVNYILNDDQRKVIMSKYLERNTLTIGEIALIIHKDRTTVSRWHTEAIRKLAIAFEPFTHEEREITNFDHIFDPNWKYDESA